MSDAPGCGDRPHARPQPRQNSSAGFDFRSQPVAASVEFERLPGFREVPALTISRGGDCFPQIRLPGYGLTEILGERERGYPILQRARIGLCAHSRSPRMCRRQRQMASLGQYLERGGFARASRSATGDVELHGGVRLRDRERRFRRVVGFFLGQCNGLVHGEGVHYSYLQVGQMGDQAGVPGTGWKATGLPFRRIGRCAAMDTASPGAGYQGRR